jgi:hypothetical protein
MPKGWEFRWLTYHYYVGAPDAAMVRVYLKDKHPDIAENAPVPMELNEGIRQKLQLVDGTVKSAGDGNKVEM